MRAGIVVYACIEKSVLLSGMSSDQKAYKGACLPAHLETERNFQFQL
jgi:hypothetical protein